VRPWPFPPNSFNSGGRTTIPGVFAVGDMHQHKDQQPDTAAGSGRMAEIDAEQFLETNKTV